MDIPEKDDILMTLTADIVSSYISHNVCPSRDLPAIIVDVYDALSQVQLKRTRETAGEKPKPAVSPKRSVTDEYIICLEDGKKFKSLKRHLMTHYNMSPEQYREKWDLESSYPMVAPNYAQARSNLAREMGLGRKRKRD